MPILDGDTKKNDKKGNSVTGNSNISSFHRKSPAR